MEATMEASESNEPMGQDFIQERIPHRPLFSGWTGSWSWMKQPSGRKNYSLRIWRSFKAIILTILLCPAYCSARQSSKPVPC